ncbi:MAG: hypothetical protein AB1780_00740 [Pseudomonadota bacterium]
MSTKVTTSTFEDFIKRHPDMAHLDPMNQIDFDLAHINKNDLVVLKRYFSDICTDLSLYMQLFSHEEHLIELNKFNGFVFSRLEKSYLEKICLKVATLMDPPKSMGNENLSLRRFIEQTKSTMLKGYYERLYEFYEKSGIKDWRNKVLAHADLAVLAGESSISINFERHDIDNFVAEIQEFIDWVSDPKIATDHKIVLPRDVDGYAFIHKVRTQNES